MDRSENGKTFMEEVRDGVQVTNNILGNHVLTALSNQTDTLVMLRHQQRDILDVLDKHTVILEDIRDSLRVLSNR